MVDIMIPFLVTSNAESEAVDLLIEVQRLERLLDIDTINNANYRRICLYLVKTADFMSDPDDLSVSKNTQSFGSFIVCLHCSVAVVALIRNCTNILNYQFEPPTNSLHSFFLFPEETMETALSLYSKKNEHFDAFASETNISSLGFLRSVRMI